MVKILVVDDTPELMNQMAEQAKGEGRKVLTAEDGEQAIGLIQQQDFAVIVTDLKMETPKSGLEVLKAAKEKNIHTQVIMITDYGAPEVSIEAMRLGAFDYLERGTPGTHTPTMLRSKITLALEFHEAKSGIGN